MVTKYYLFTETESGELKLPTDELLEQPSKLNKSKKFSLLRKSEETLIVNVKYSMINLILESLTYLLTYIYVRYNGKGKNHYIFEKTNKLVMYQNKAICNHDLL